MLHIALQARNNARVFDDRCGLYNLRGAVDFRQLHGALVVAAAAPELQAVPIGAPIVHEALNGALLRHTVVMHTPQR